MIPSVKVLQRLTILAQRRACTDGEDFCVDDAAGFNDGEVLLARELLTTLADER